MAHIPVLLHESIDGLDIKRGDIVLDGTLGGGGHTSEIVKRFGSDVKVIGVDLDADALGRAKEALQGMKSDTIFKVSGFQDADAVLDELNIPHVDRILLDLGLSSFQLEASERGFSFMRDEPLLMTMKKNPGDEDITAMDIVNTWEEKTLADILYGFGEEKYARKIARAIVMRRVDKPFKTTKDLSLLLTATVGKAYGRSKIHPGTRTFQALRIAVNGELSNIEHAIPMLFGRLDIGGRLAIISFHSLEDRIVKHTFRALAEGGNATIITKKPIIPGSEEMRANPRARSAKLRIIEKKNI